MYFAMLSLTSVPVARMVNFQELECCMCLFIEFGFECVCSFRSDPVVLSGILHFPGWIVYSHNVRNAADTR